MLGVSNNCGLLSVLLLVLFAVQGFAVDRTKFRTCDQSSFCRRHRKKASSSLYKYRLAPDSLKFYVPNAEETNDTEQGQDSSLWKSFSKRLLGKGEKPVDPYVRGTPPTLTGKLINVSPETSTGGEETLVWSVHAMVDGLVRMRVHEVYGAEDSAGKAYESARVTYDDLILIEEDLLPANHVAWMRASTHEDYLKKLIPTSEDINNYTALQYGDSEGGTGNNMVLLIRFTPFSLSLYRERDIEIGPIMTLNTEEMMHFEIRRFKERNENTESQEDMEDTTSSSDIDKKQGENSEKEIVGYWEDGLAIYADGTREEKGTYEDQTESHRKLAEASSLDREGMWEENFQSHKDSKPNGPMSVGMDLSFPGSQHIYGLPEHASSLVLKETVGDGSHYSQPYRLYNLDVFEYELDETMSIYGNIPLVVSHSMTTGTSGVFWFNPTETHVDVMKNERAKGKSTHWISESGIIDVFMLPGGSKPSDLYRQYSKITGKTPLPPMFSLGYHQCRWNYKDEKDVFTVHDTFEELDYPYDVLWLDIEHTEGKRYFTWDSNNFPEPKAMQERLWSQGRRMVTIVDPHIARDNNYRIHKEATAKGFYVKNKEGKDFDGWCWPGSSSYLDFTNDDVRNWWADQFAYNKYEGTTPSLFTWNDMNEPSVFNGPEVTMQKDLVNLHGEESREWHNLYGILFHKATAMGQIRRNQGEDLRPFVLSRSFFAGSQRYGAIWTGDNFSEWPHLEISNPMLLSMNVGALSFVGADVGGFFGNPDAELMTRWMQAGAYQPFFRGHAHHDAKRREPWMFGEETMRLLRKVAMARYALLPMWYTVFWEAEMTGMPVMRTMWMQYPKAEELFSVDNQYLIGADLLVRPVTSAGVQESEVLFPTKDSWYDVYSNRIISAGNDAEVDVKRVTVPSDISKIPVFQRGGSILARKLRLRRSSFMMKKDPYTLYIAMNVKMEAAGKIYMDDEETFGHVKRDEYAVANLSATQTKIENVVELGSGWQERTRDMEKDRMIERIVIMGIGKSPTSIQTSSGANIEFEHDAVANVLVLRKPDVSAISQWEIKLN